MMGNPNRHCAESNNSTIGILSPMSSAMDKMTNFCWCLFFIFCEWPKALKNKSLWFTNLKLN
jgi:hypothetical protein